MSPKETIVILKNALDIYIFFFYLAGIAMSLLSNCSFKLYILLMSFVLHIHLFALSLYHALNVHKSYFLHFILYILTKVQIKKRTFLVYFDFNYRDVLCPSAFNFFFKVLFYPLLTFWFSILLLIVIQILCAAYTFYNW